MFLGSSAALWLSLKNKGPSACISCHASAMCSYGAGLCFISCLIINLSSVDLAMHDPTKKKEKKKHPTKTPYIISMTSLFVLKITRIKKEIVEMSLEGLYTKAEFS